MNTVDDQIARQLKRIERLPQRAIELSGNHVVNNTRKFSGQAQVNTRMSINGQGDSKIRLAPFYFRNAIPDSKENRQRHFAVESKKVKIGDTVRIGNPLDYIENVEYQLGDLMFNKAVAMWKEHNRQALAEI